jgi:glutathione peroxidase-family protein/uncharacterized membrane protein
MKTSTLQNIMKIVLGSFMTLAGIGHMTFQREEFQAQVPSWLPKDPAFIDFVVLSSGVLEVLLGLSLIFLIKYKVNIGIALALFYVAVFPGNISQYTNEISAFGLDTDQKRFIRLFFQPVLILWALWSTGALKKLMGAKNGNAHINFDEFILESINGQKVPMSQFKGKTIIVVNTASKCGLTPQYEGLENLYRTYKEKGLVILGFPCNQFGNQESGNASEIEEFCSLNYGVSFPMFSKTDVNGKNAHPLFIVLKSQLGSLFGSDIKWNFTKFVIDKTGKPVKRFAPTTTPETMEAYIQKII